jgi:Tol biopolymer transport system component
MPRHVQTKEIPMLSRRRGRVLAAALGLTAIVLGWVAQAYALSPTRAVNGRIVFRRYLDVGKTSAAIFTVNPNGKRAVRVTRAGPGVIDTEPDWSADGRMIAFTRQSPCPPDGPKNGLNGTCDLVYTMRRDGSDLRQLVPCGFDAGAASSPATCVGVNHAGWSPDGSKLAFQYNLVDRRYAGSFNVQAGIWIVNADGTDLHQVTQGTPGTSWDFGPQWSPDGTRLVLFRLDLATSHEAVFTVRTDGTGEARLSPGDLDAANPNWSPEDGSVLFNASSADGASNLYRARADGTGLANLTRQGPTGFHYLSASFSPDGMRIAASRTPGTGLEGAADVVVMRADGSHARPVTRTRLWDSGADWGAAPLIH